MFRAKAKSTVEKRAEDVLKAATNIQERTNALDAIMPDTDLLNLNNKNYSNQFFSMGEKP